MTVQIIERLQELGEALKHTLKSIAITQDTRVAHDVVVLVDIEVDVSPLDQLHRIKIALILVIEIVEVHEVRVREVRDRAELSLKIMERARIIELELF